VQAKPGIQGTLSLIQLDANDDASIESAAKKIEQDFHKLDVLINNAGVCPETDGQWPANRQQMRTIFETNVFGPTLLTEALIPVMKHSSNPRIINVSSTLGSMSMISDHSSPYSQVKYPAYRMSKAALNMLTAYQYAQLKDGFKVWTYCPGYVVTDLGGDREERKAQGLESSETSAQGLLQIVQGERDADVGGFVGRRGEKYGW
jgi:NAD(P)-dependent dehydrogenase (short-subunit alcohol dehydrogenase family)